MWHCSVVQHGTNQRLNALHPECGTAVWFNVAQTNVWTHCTLNVALQCGSKWHRPTSEHTAPRMWHCSVVQRGTDQCLNTLYCKQNNKCEGKAICHDGIWCSRGLASLIPNFGTKSGSVVSCKPHLLYPTTRTPQWPLNRMLGGLCPQSEHFLEDKDLLPLSEIKPWTIQPVCRSIQWQKYPGYNDDDDDKNSSSVSDYMNVK
jgi:hypothetical protein